jgi:hypothetical protein
MIRKWIDTCCINKTSSAELSEAINSMFGWYERAEVCYAYLSDAFTDPADLFLNDLRFEKSQWFRRGWTLQELLAPYYVDFFDKGWNWIGSKASLDELIKATTGISDLLNYKAASVAQKMSWASKRETTRIEDQAYCLLGLFGVYMAPLYGEGESAFLRLQMEIINKVDDDSILAWDRDSQSGSGLLATSPKDFAYCSSIVRLIWDTERPPYTMTSRGLCVHLPLIPDDGSVIGRQTSVAPLNCAVKDSGGKLIALRMYQNAPGDEWLWDPRNLWRRDPRRQLVNLASLDLRHYQEIGRTMIHVPQFSVLEQKFFTTRSSGGPIRMNLSSIDSLVNIGFGVKKHLVRESTDNWQKDDQSNLSDEKWHVAITLESVNNQELQKAGIVLGLSKGRLWIDVVVLEPEESIEQILDSASSVRTLLIGSDKISRPFLYGSLNARLKKLNGRISGVDLHNQAVEVIFDPEGTLRWPVRKDSNYYRGSYETAWVIRDQGDNDEIHEVRDS